MPMRNSDEIKRLKYELGRYRKKVGDDAAVIADLRRSLEAARRTVIGTHMGANAMQAALALRYGVDADDPDRPGVVLGKRLVLPAYGVEDMLKQYEVHARKGEDGAYVIGVVSREEASKGEKRARE